MTEHGGNLKATRTLDVHKEAIGALYKTLELVGSGLLFGGGVKKIDRHLYGLWDVLLIICFEREGERESMLLVAMHREGSR